MKNFKYFKDELIKGNTSGVKKRYNNSFLNEIIDEKTNLRPIHLACSNGFYEIVQFFLDNHCDIEQDTNDGWTAIHWAVFHGHLEIVRLLADHNCNLECEDKKGRRAIHFASLRNHFFILTFLINRGCDILCKTEEGKTPLDYALAKQNKTCVKYLEMTLLMKKSTSLGSIEPGLGPKANSKFYVESHESNTETAIGQAIMDVENPIKNNDLLTYIDIVERSENADGVALLSECCLYRCIKYRHIEGFKIFNTPQTINRHRKLIKNSFLEVAVEFFSRGFIKDILQKTIYDKEVWDKAKNDARETKQMETLIEILNREFVLTSRKQANISILHTAVCDNDPDMVKYILDNPSLADKDLNNPRIGTALAFAHMLHHKLCINILEQYDVDVNTQNKLLETSLHEAIASGMHMKCEYLIDNSVDIDRVNSMGLTALQCAVIKGFEDVCEKLLRKGADCTRYIEVSNRSLAFSTLIEDPIDQPLTSAENALTLCIKIHRTIYSCFFDNFDERMANTSDGEMNTLLHLAVKSFLPSTCSSLLKAGAEIDRMNGRSNSALMELLFNASETIQDNFEEIIEILKILVESGADVMKMTMNGETIFSLASKLREEKLMCSLISSNSLLTYFNEDDFVSAFIEKWFDYAEKLVNNLSDHFLSANISKQIIKLCLEHNKVSLIKSLFHKSDYIVQQSVLEDIIYHSTETDNEDLFIFMIDEELACPRRFENGETLLTNLLLDRRFEFCRKVLRSVNGTKYLKTKNFKNRSPLHVAIDVGDMDMIYDLVNETSTFNHEDDDGHTPLTKLFEKISICNDATFESELYAVIQLIIKKGGKLYITTKTGNRVIDACSKCSIRTEIETFFTNMNRSQFHFN